LIATSGSGLTGGGPRISAGEQANGLIIGHRDRKVNPERLRVQVRHGHDKTAYQLRPIGLI